MDGETREQPATHVWQYALPGIGLMGGDCYTTPCRGTAVQLAQADALLKESGRRRRGEWMLHNGGGVWHCDSEPIPGWQPPLVPPLEIGFKVNPSLRPGEVEIRQGDRIVGRAVNVGTQTPGEAPIPGAERARALLRDFAALCQRHGVEIEDGSAVLLGEDVGDFDVKIVGSAARGDLTARVWGDPDVERVYLDGRPDVGADGEPRPALAFTGTLRFSMADADPRPLPAGASATVGPAPFPPCPVCGTEACTPPTVPMARGDRIEPVETNALCPSCGAQYTRAEGEAAQRRADPDRYRSRGTVERNPDGTLSVPAEMLPTAADLERYREALRARGLED